MTYYLGIDPGCKGGLCAIVDGRIHAVAKLPESPDELFSWLILYRGKSVVCLESVTGYIPPAEGRSGNTQPGSRMFKLGESVGVVRGMLSGLGWREPSTLVRAAPRAWQSGLGVSAPGLSYAARKAHLAAQARALYPGKKITGQVADAVLLATYCYRVYRHTTKEQ